MSPKEIEPANEDAAALVPDGSEPGRERLLHGMSKAQRDAQRRARLLDAGLETFGTAGFQTSTIGGLCRRARVTERNFYDHFASREELLLAVYEEIILEVQQALLEAVAVQSRDPEAAVRAVIETFVRTMAKDERRMRINFIEVVGASPEIELRRRNAVEGFAFIARSEIERLMREGSIPSRDARLTVSPLVGAIQESLVAWMSESSDVRPALSAVIAEDIRIVLLALTDPVPNVPTRRRLSGTGPAAA